MIDRFGAARRGAARGNPGHGARRDAATASRSRERRPKRTSTAWRTSRNCSPTPASSTKRTPAAAHLEEFLENAWLVNETDDWEAESDKVTMMTLHAAKGLEFPVVFIVAVEQGLLPHERSINDDEQLEEERRLVFVGITRAKEELQLSYAVHRDFRGQRRRTVPSPFLLEMPREEMELRPRRQRPLVSAQLGRREFADVHHGTTTAGVDLDERRRHRRRASLSGIGGHPARHRTERWKDAAALVTTAAKLTGAVAAARRQASRPTTSRKA